MSEAKLTKEVIKLARKCFQELFVSFAIQETCDHKDYYMMDLVRWKRNKFNRELRKLKAMQK